MVRSPTERCRTYSPKSRLLLRLNTRTSRAQTSSLMPNLSLIALMNSSFSISPLVSMFSSSQILRSSLTRSFLRSVFLTSIFFSYLS